MFHTGPNNSDFFGFWIFNGEGYVENPKFGSKNGSVGGQWEKDLEAKIFGFGRIFGQKFFFGFWIF